MIRFKPKYQMAGTPGIAYILKGFPRISEAFIANEIYLLEQKGIRLAVYVIKKSNEKIRHSVIDKIQSPLVYLPHVDSLSNSPFLSWLIATLPVVFSDHLRLFMRRPYHYLRAFLKTLSWCFRYRSADKRGPRKIFIKEFFQAGSIALSIVRDPSITHIHAHFCHGATTIAMMVSDLTGRPFSFTAHAKDIYLKSLNPGKLLERKIHQARFVVTCTGTNHQHIKTVSPNGTPIHTIYHGLNTEDFSPRAESAASPAIPEILSIGRFVEKKGFPYLIEACAILHKRGYKFHCNIVGEPGEESRRVEQLIDSLGLRSMITIHAAASQEVLRSYYRRAAMFVLPCVLTRDGDRDGIPNVIAEAMAMQVPVVSTTVSGIPELVASGTDGLLVQPNSPQALADAMMALLDNPALAGRLGQSGRKTVLEKFDSATTTETLKNLFEEQCKIAQI